MSGRARTLLDRVEGTVLGDLVEALRRTRVVDLAYTIAAQAFVALIPLVLVVTSAFTAGGDQAVVARDLVERFGLAGAARVAVQQLFDAPGSRSGVYWLGLFVTLLSAFSLSRRVARAYASIWEVPALPRSQQWRGLVWLLVAGVMTFLASGLRGLASRHGGATALLAFAALLLVWAVGEYVTQLLLTAGQVARGRLLAAAVVVTVGRLGVLVWSGLYLPRALERQSELYGPVGVVFGLFTWILALVAVLLLGSLLAAVGTARPVSGWLRPTRVS